MKRKRWWGYLLGLFLVGAALTWVALDKTVEIVIGEQNTRLRTTVLTVGQALEQAGIPLYEGDMIFPAAEAWLQKGQTIQVIRAAWVQIQADGQISSLWTTERAPGNLLALAGVTLDPGDEVLHQGQPIAADQPLASEGRPLTLQVRRQVSLTLHQGAQSQLLTTRQVTLGQALWEAGVILRASDQLQPGFDTPVANGLQAFLIASRLVSIQVDQRLVQKYSTAGSVQAALLDAGLALQGLDTSIPSPESALPANGAIRVVRVYEEAWIEQTPLPFETQYQPVEELEIDHQQIVQAGEYGLMAQRIRVRYEDGQEVSRQVEGEWLARQPQERIIGYGTKLVPHTMDTPDGPITYWRALSMWAVSYHPASAGGEITATGLRVRKGLAAVDTRYIPFFTQMYVQGYGEALAADTGGGIKGRIIDLAYSDEDYIEWHEWVTVYFLWPPPANIVWIIP